MKRNILISLLIVLALQTVVSATIYYVDPASRSFPTIESALNDLGIANGDTVLVAPGTYTPPTNAGYNFSPIGTRNIILKSWINLADPDPNIIADTIIDCQGIKGSPKRAFHFDSGENNSAQVLGFTIINGYQEGTAAAAGPFPSLNGPVFLPDDDCEYPWDANDGLDAISATDPLINDGYGGAFLIEAASSPTIGWCVIKDNTVTGPVGGRGANGQNGQWTMDNPCNDPCDPNDDAPPLEWDDGQWAGDGGDGIGTGFGGAMAVRGASNPIIHNCTFENNQARGGVGGDGGNGGNATTTDGGITYSGMASFGGNAGDSMGDGVGGAIYADSNSHPVVSNSIFNGNIATTGSRGQGGLAGAGNAAAYDFLPANTPATDGFPSFVWGNGGIAGGAAYHANTSNASYTLCDFINNQAYEGDFFPPTFSIGPEVLNYTIGGAIYIDSNNTVPSTVALDSSNFRSNMGGALYCGPSTILNINNTADPENLCIFADNSDMQDDDDLTASTGLDFGSGAAIYLDTGCTVSIQNTSFSGNTAKNDGGAIESASSIATLSSCSFGNNQASRYGGAVDIYEPLGANLMVNIDDCSFNGNQAQYGGAFAAERLRAGISFITDSIFINNNALSGGALDIFDGNVIIAGCTISDNRSTGNYGAGGAMDLTSTVADIMHCTIQDNTAEGANATGGAINIYGLFDGLPGNDTHITNSLLTGNQAVADGGAIACSASVTPDVNNCTFSDNSTDGFGGAIYADDTSNPLIANSIFNNNTGHAIHEEDNGGDATVIFSLFNNNPEGDYYDSGTTTVYAGAAQIPAIPSGANNQYGDPIFVNGPLGSFYLMQTDANDANYPGQTQDSNAINLGNVNLAAFNPVTFGWDPTLYTTRTNNAGDNAVLDMGYHYPKIADVNIFELTITVDSGSGTLEVVSPAPIDYNSVTGIYTFYAGTIVTLQAAPAGGWKVNTWTGTDDDSSTNNINIATMNSNKNVRVQFNLPRTLIVSVGGGGAGYFANIQDAIHNSNDGDVIIVYPGIYYGPAIQVTKSVEIRSLHPEDPSWVDQTIIDRTGYANRAFIFQTGSEGAVLNGLTIQNCNWVILDNYDATRPGLDGGSNGGAAGAAIVIDAGVSTTFKNCVFRDNRIRGGHGSNGANADISHNAGRGGWGHWARGGAVYCGQNSTVLFENCRMIDNTAVGGNGGDGGDEVTPGGVANYGGNWSRAEWINIQFTTSTWEQGDLWAVWQSHLVSPDGQTSTPTGNYIGDYRWYTGYGGAVYCDNHSNVTFDNCTISGNLAQGGMSGLGGERLGENPEPEFRYELPSFGGGVYCSFDSTVTFINCNIADNLASDPTFDHTPEDTGLGAEYDPLNKYRVDPYLGHGGGVCAEDTAKVTFIGCDVRDNTASVGGGINFANANPVIRNSNIISNTAYQGGGIFGQDGQADIINSDFIGNMAISDANDTNVIILAQGGAVHFWAADVNIANSYFSQNYAQASGGAIFFGGEGYPTLFNCLITDNTADRDGGGVANNYYSQLSIENCTIVDNIVTGNGFDNDYSGGGAIFATSTAFTQIINSIIWDNYSFDGSQITISEVSGGSQKPLVISYSDIGPMYDPTEFAVRTFGIAASSKLVDSQAIYDQFTAGATKAEVIVTLQQPTKPSNWNSQAQLNVYNTQVQNLIQSVLATLPSYKYDLRHSFKNIAGFSCDITTEGIDILLANSSVKYIEPVRYVQPTLRQAIPLANALVPRLTYDGTGIAIAIVDSGVDYTHPMLGNGTFPNSKVIGGYDTGDNDPDPMPSDEAHGTACAGIAAGDIENIGDYIGGVAHNAKIYALKMAADTGFWPIDAGLDAWDWCVTHQNDDTSNPLLVMSNSWGAIDANGGPILFDNAADADAFSPAMAEVAQRAVDAGIAILAASGNDYSAGEGISWPAAMSNVISVGAVFDTTDEVTGYSNTADNLDILAPADPMYTTDIVGPLGYSSGDYTPNFNGTSSATPFAAGVVAAIQQASKEKLGDYHTPSSLRELLIRSGDPVTDTKVPITKPRVNLGNAIDSFEFRAPITLDGDLTIDGFDANDPCDPWAPNTFNIQLDPNFIDGYRLPQIAAGQLYNSIAVNAGSDLALVIGLHMLTTRTDSIPDDYNSVDPMDDPNNAIVDMGYHYNLFTPDTYALIFTAIDNNDIADPCDQPFIITPLGGETYPAFTNVYLEVTTPPDQYEVVWSGTENDDSNEPANIVEMDGDKLVTVTYDKIRFNLTVNVNGSGGTVTPTSGVYRRNEVVSITATPDEGMRVKAWTGTEDDTSVELNNTVIMDDDKIVTVEFELPQIITVPGEYSSIQQAFDAAQEGDTILIGTGTYITSAGYTIYDKNVIISSENPDDPCVVAATVIQLAAGASGGVSSAFNIMNVGRETVINGITIRGFTFTSLSGLDGVNAGDSGFNGGTATGGAFDIINASPTIKNCMIIDCGVTGGNGGNGAAGADPNLDGGHGGWPGGAYGGGMYIAGNSSPQIINTTFVNCYAIGGNGGNGGDGADADPLYGDGGLGGGWYYPFPVDWPYGPYRFYTKYSGLGGAVYVGQTSSPVFRNCTFENNTVSGGFSGIQGISQPSGLIGEPSINWKIDTFGGAVYCDANSLVTFVGCHFEDNFADTSYPANNDDPFVSLGGAVAFEDGADVTFNDCSFNNNTAAIGGGVYANDSRMRVTKSEFSANNAYNGGGLYFVDGSVDIIKCDITNNSAVDINTIGDANAVVLGNGGGIYCSSSDAYIADNIITYNKSNKSGGGIYLAGDSDPDVFNCLIANNEAGSDGGGISVSWSARAYIENCTIVNNEAVGLYGETTTAGYGGGLFAGYDGNTVVIDTIIRDNFARQEGQQVAIKSSDGQNSAVTISYSDILGAQGQMYIDTNSTLNWETGNFDIDPIFATGPLGEYYLSQTDAGNPADSPCLNTGSDTAENIGLAMGYTTRTDHVSDKQTVDVGFHYPLEIYEQEECKIYDLNDDFSVDFYDLQIILADWLSLLPSDADFNEDGIVDLLDISIFAQCWAVNDDNPPYPSPLQWEIVPYALSQSSTEMVAVQARDTWTNTIFYYYECVSGPCNDSGWLIEDLNEPNYIDTGLPTDTVVGYRVKAKDERGNETQWSTIKYIQTTTDIIAPVTDPDANAPARYRSTWDGPLVPDATKITMRVTPATDESGVEYYFKCTDGGADPNIHDSGWQDSTEYEATGLLPETTYTFKVRAQDKSPLKNGGDYSLEDSATTLTDDANAPEPAPTITANTAYESIGSSYHQTIINTVAVTDDIDPRENLEINFICVHDSARSSGWVPMIGVADITVHPDSVVSYAGDVVTYDAFVSSFTPPPVYDWYVCVRDVAELETCSPDVTTGSP